MVTTLYFYAVVSGRKPGIYTTWEDCERETKGFSNNLYKRFRSSEEATAFMRSHAVKFDLCTDTTKTAATNTTDTPAKIARITPHSCGLIDSEDDVEENRAFRGSFEVGEAPKELINDHSRLVAFTDGACIGNGSPSAKAGFAIVWPFWFSRDFSGKVPHHQGYVPTSNRAELLGVIHAIETAVLSEKHKTRKLWIYSDSDLVIKSLTKWLPNWKRNGWINSQGKKIANLDLIRNLDQLLNTGIKIVFVKVRAHTNAKDWMSLYNAAADKAAYAAAANSK